MKLLTALLALSFSLAFSQGRSLAADPDPGFLSMQFGDLEITALLDSQGQMGPDILFDRSAADLNADLAAAGLSGGFPSWINAFAVKRGDDVFVIDTGTGNPEGALKNLRAAGIDPAAVNYVLLTHFHMDHVGGLLNPDGTPAFPNARVYAALEESLYFLPDGGPPHSGGAALPPLFGPYRDNGSYVTFSPGGELLPGVETEPLFGHTPGHTGYVFESSAGKVIFFGDIIHVYLVQFAHPEVTISYDVSRPDARATREALLPRLARDKWLVAGAHLPFPGIGTVTEEAPGFKWYPVNED